MRRWSAAFVTALCAVLYLAPTAAPADVTSEMLPNGMKVLVREDHKAPVVISQLWVKVGSNYETPDVLGCSHLIEHMIFNKGTAKRGVGQMSREVADAGGIQNAGTGYEATSYFVTVPSENFDVALDVQADALISASFDADELEKEREVVIEENKMYSDIPDGYGEAWNKLLTKAYTVSPYRRSIGGPEEVLRSASRDDILTYKKHFYVPSNMTLVIVGDIETGEVLDKVRAAYAGFNGPPPFPRLYAMEPPQEAFRYLAYAGDVSQAYMKFGYHSVPEMAEDQPAFAVMSKVLAGSRSSRIHQNVREKQGLISSVEVLSENGPRQGYFVLDVVADVPKAAPAQEAVLREIEKLKAGFVSGEELTRAKNLVLRDFLFAMETVDGQAQNLGFYDAMGDHTYALRYPDLVRAVTAEDVMAAARRYLDLANLTLAVYYPVAAEGQIDTDEAVVRARLEAATPAGAADVAPMGGARRVRALRADVMAPGMTVRAGAPDGGAPACGARPCDKAGSASRCASSPCGSKTCAAKSCRRMACGDRPGGEGATLFGWLRRNIGERVFGTVEGGGAASGS
jgi:zinc protease